MENLAITITIDFSTTETKKTNYFERFYDKISNYLYGGKRCLFI